MQLDKTMLDRLLSLDDDALAATIRRLSAAAGLAPSAAEEAVKDLRRVRRTLSTATDADLQKAAEKLLSHGIRLAAVTLGADGAYIACDVFKGYIPPYTDVKTIDTTGAGDTFWGTMMYEYLTHGFGTDDLVRRAAERASKAAALCTSKKGAAPSIPEYDEI